MKQGGFTAVASRLYFENQAVEDMLLCQIQGIFAQTF